MDQEEIKKDWFNSLRDSVRKALRDVKVGASGLGVQGGEAGQGTTGATGSSG